MGLVDPSGQPIASTSRTDEEIVYQMIAELQAYDEPLLVGPLAPLEALQLAGLMQLTLRHPHLSDEHRAIAAAVVDTVREYFAGSPTILEILDRGDDPAEDIHFAQVGG